ncbi:MAG: right-handed parallel beta-helix repeat-containing protein [Promethearchaeota archaeon]
MKRVVVTPLIVFLIVLSATGSFAVMQSHFYLKSIKVTPVHSNNLAQLETRDPIHIGANSDFALVGATGVGTPSDPYRFENLTIASNATCIIVENTTAHFVISNCRLETFGASGAITFSNVENGRVVSCEVANAAFGITVIDSLNVSLENTTIYGSSYGIALNGVANATIVDCTIFYNYRGVVLDRTNRSQVRHNTVYGNMQLGIQIGFSSHNNSIYGNSIGWNVMNAIDTGADNYFDDNVSIGNRWSDFNESESYVITGTANSVDSFAQLLEDNVAPYLMPIYDVAIDIDSVGNTLTWLAHDEFPRSYKIQENQVDKVISVWTGGDVSYGVDHLMIGTYNVTIILTDGAQHEASDEVLVSVASRILGGIGTELVMIASGITAASFGIVVILSKRLS